MTPTRVVCGFLAALLLTGTVVAEETSKSERWVKVRTFHFDTKRLVPRVSLELESLSAHRRVSQPGQQLQDHVLFDRLAADVRRDVERMARKAVKNYLMEAINLDRKINKVKMQVRGEQVEQRGMSFRLGFHSQLPVVGMSYDTGPGEMGLKIGADGAVGLHYRDGRMKQADFSATFDGEDRFEFRALLAF